MKRILTVVLVGLAVANGLVAVNTDLTKDDLISTRSILSLRRRSVPNTAFEHDILLDGKGGNGRDSSEEDGTGNHGGHHNSGEASSKGNGGFHDSPWMPIGVIAGFLVIASICFIAIQRHRQRRAALQSGQKDASGELSEFEKTAPPPQLLVDGRSERLKKISTIIPIADGPVVIDPNAEHWVHEELRHDTNPVDAPPAYDTISIYHPIDAWVHETVSVPKGSTQERF